MSFIGTVNDALLLVALGIGYFVLYFAKREEKTLQLVGYAIGCIIITLAASYMLLNSLWSDPARFYPARAGYSRPKMEHRMMQPRMMQPRTQQAPTQKP